MSIPREGSRDTGKGILVSCVPDWCWVQHGKARVLTPFRIHAKQANDANTAPTVRQQGKRSHTSGSLITVCHGDEAGNALGVKSGTKESVCWPITWSQSVRIEGKHAVRHNDLWAMNNGNTVGKLAYVEDTEVHKKPKSKVKSDLPPDSNSVVNQDVKAQVSDAFGPQNTFGEPTQVAQASTGNAADVSSRGAGTATASTPTTAAGVSAMAAIAIPVSSGWGGGLVGGAGGVEAAAGSGALLGTALTTATGVGIVAAVVIWPTPLDSGNDAERIKEFLKGRPAPLSSDRAVDNTKDGAQPDVKAKANVRVSRVNPCILLACPPPRPGSKYRGGAHGCTRLPYGDVLDSHHTPADDASPLPRSMGPAIQMDPTDHKLTASYGGGVSAEMYRAAQRQLISGGNFAAAIAMDVADISGKFRKKYAAAIAQMGLYAACLKKNGIVK